MALLAYLATQPDTCSRERLATMLWEESDEGRAAANLRHALHTLRSTMPEGLVLDNDLVGLDRRHVFVDLDFVRLAVGPEDLEEAARLRRGPFCDGLLIRDSTSFDDWLSLQRQEWDAIWLALLMSLSQSRFQAGDHEGAMEAAREALLIDRLYEPAHGQLIRLLLAHGEPAAASRHFEECQRLFMDELGVPPSPEITALLQAAEPEPPLVPSPALLPRPSVPAPRPAVSPPAAVVSPSAPATARPPRVTAVPPLLPAPPAGTSDVAAPLRQVLDSVDVPPHAVQQIVEAFVQSQSMDPDRLQVLEEALRAVRETGGSDLPATRERVVGPVPMALVGHFRGRSAELGFLRQHFATPDVRLISVTGRGGVGKTALVTRFLLDLQRRAEGPEAVEASSALPLVDRIVYASVRASEFRSLDPIVDLICRTLEPDVADLAREHWQGKDPLWMKLDFLLRNSLSESRFLVVLDNFEEVLGPDDRILAPFDELRQFVEAVLSWDHWVTLVTVSRRALLLPPELEGSLGKARVELLLDEGLALDDAVGLMRDLDSDGQLGVQDADEVLLCEVATACHCIPRTLEALIGTLRQRRTLTLERLLADELLTRLSENPARELFEGMTPEARLVMQVLAIFERPVALASIQCVLPGLDLDEIVDALVRCGAVLCDRGRFWLQPLDRQYALTLVAADGPCSAAALHVKAARFFEQVRKPRARWRSVDDLEPHFEAFRHLVAAGRPDDACAVLDEIEPELLLRWGYADLVVKMRGSLAEAIVDPIRNESNLGMLGQAWSWAGNADRAISLLKTAARMARTRKDTGAHARWIGLLGNALSDAGDLHEAIGYYEQAVQLARTARDGPQQSRWLGQLGDAHLALGSMDRAFEYASEAREMARREGDSWLEGVWEGILGVARGFRGQLAEAIEHFEKALAVAVQDGEPGLQAEWHTYLGNAAVNLGDLEKASAHFQEALGLARVMQRRRYECFAMDGLGDVSWLQGRIAEARDWYGQALVAAREASDRVVMVHPLRGLGLMHHLGGDLDEAEATYRDGLALNRPLSNYRFSVKLALLAMERGDERAARHRWDEATQACKQLLERTPDLYWARYQLALADLAQGRTAEARKGYKRALAACPGRGVRLRALEMLELLGRVKGFEAKVAELSKMLEPSVNPTSSAG